MSLPRRTEASDAATSLDEARLRHVVGEHYAFIWRSLRRLGVSQSRAEDAAQQVLIVAARKLATVEAGRERAFLFAVVMRVAADERRARRRHPQDQLSHDELLHSDQGPLPDELLDRQRARALADTLLAELPLELSAVFVLAEVEEMTASAIADLLGLPPGTVASRLRRARKQFEAALARHRTREQNRRPR